jgi:transcriptional regulator
MYIPKAFEEKDVKVLQTFMRKHSFATLITQQDAVPLANHLPFMLDTQHGPYGTLMTHMARANEQWRTFEVGKEVLVLFQGPHTYVSPSWYSDDVELSVPTWNYSAVHAYGIPSIIDDHEELYSMLKRLVQLNEAQFERPWQLQLTGNDAEKKMRSIVGVAIEITRLEGKFKLSQNRSQGDQARVIEALQDGLSPATAELMKERLHE